MQVHHRINLLKTTKQANIRQALPEILKEKKLRRRELNQLKKESSTSIINYKIVSSSSSPTPQTLQYIHLKANCIHRIYILLPRFNEPRPPKRQLKKLLPEHENHIQNSRSDSKRMPQTKREVKIVSTEKMNFRKTRKVSTKDAKAIINI